VAVESGGRRPAVRAEPDRWVRLGELLQLRREALGYRYRPGFTAERGINIRMVTDIENAHRPNTFSLPALQQIARAYAVTYDSVTAVLRGEAGGLVPAESPAPGGTAAESGLPGLPLALDAARLAAAWPFASRIIERLLAARGVTAPSGAVLFDDPEDAGTWDALCRRWSVLDSAWMIADLHARDARPPGGLRQDGTAS